MVACPLLSASGDVVGGTNMIFGTLLANSDRQKTEDAAPEERVRRILNQVREGSGVDQRQALLDELVDLTTRLEESETAGRRQASMAFLLLLREDPEILENGDYRRFVAEMIDSNVLYRVKWESPDEVISVAEALYSFRFKDTLSPNRVTEYVRDLVRHALRQFERSGEPELMFQLLQQAPIPAAMMDAELVRIRNRLLLFEQRRVSRKRRLLYFYLALQVFLIFLLFPLVFQNVENGLIQRQVEETTGLEIENGRIKASDDLTLGFQPRQFLSFPDAVYWSVITYGSIGYGDIAPVTLPGKVLAGLHGLMGVLTVGIIAGLILSWITPRDLK